MRTIGILNQINFRGWKKADSPCLLVTDLTGTWVNGNPNDLKKIPKALSIAKKHNAYIVYATGAKSEEVDGLLDFAYEILKVVSNKPNISDVYKPDFIIAEDGNVIYSVVNGEKIKINEYDNVLSARLDKKPTKATGVRFLQKLLNILPDEKVMIGNGDNDVPMLKLAFNEQGYFICPENASKELKNFAKKYKGKNIIPVDKSGTRALLKGLSRIIPRKK